MVRPTPALFALLAALSGCAADYNETQACAQPDVLRLVSDRVQRAGLPRRMETDAIGQAPGPSPDIVLCAIWVHRLVYDTPVFGQAPVDELASYQYRLQIRRNTAFLLPGSGFTPALR